MTHLSNNVQCILYSFSLSLLKFYQNIIFNFSNNNLITQVSYLYRNDIPLKLRCHVRGTLRIFDKSRTHENKVLNRLKNYTNIIAIKVIQQRRLKSFNIHTLLYDEHNRYVLFSNRGACGMRDLDRYSSAEARDLQFDSSYPRGRTRRSIVAYFVTYMYRRESK